MGRRLSAWRGRRRGAAEGEDDRDALAILGEGLVEVACGAHEVEAPEARVAVAVGVGRLAAVARDHVLVLFGELVPVVVGAADEVLDALTGEAEPGAVDGAHRAGRAPRDGRQLTHGAARIAADDLTEDAELLGAGRPGGDLAGRVPSRRSRRARRRSRAAAARGQRTSRTRASWAGEVCLRAREPVTRAPELARRGAVPRVKEQDVPLYLRVAVALKGDARRVAVEIGEHGLGGERARLGVYRIGRAAATAARPGAGHQIGDTRCDALTPPLRLRGAHSGAPACKTSHYGPVHANPHPFHRRARRELSTGPLRLW